MARVAADTFAPVGAATLELARQLQFAAQTLGDQLDDPELKAIAARMKLRNERWAADPSGREEMSAATRSRARKAPKANRSNGDSTQSPDPGDRQPVFNFSPGG